MWVFNSTIMNSPEGNIITVSREQFRAGSSHHHERRHVEPSEITPLLYFPPSEWADNQSDQLNEALNLLPSTEKAAIEQIVFLGTAAILEQLAEAGFEAEAAQLRVDCVTARSMDSSSDDIRDMVLGAVATIAPELYTRALMAAELAGDTHRTL